MNEDNKKVVGILIPEECGKADKYELIAIMYNVEGTDEWIFRLNSAPFSEIQSTLFRKSSAYLSGAECSCLISTQMESLFHSL